MAQKRLWLWIAGLILWGSLRGLVPLLPVPSSLLPIAWLLTVVGGIALLIWLAFDVGKVLTTKVCAIVGLVVSGLRIALAFLPVPQALFWQFAVGVLADTLTLASALLLGSSISGLVRDANLFPPVAIVLTVVDIWTVWLGGFVARIQQKAQEGVAIAQKVIEAATVKVPTIVTAQYTHLGIPVIGVGDLFFSAFLFTLLWRFGLNTELSFILSVAFVSLGLLLAQLPFFPFGVPGLPFIVLAVLLPNLKAFKYTAEEKKALLVGAVFFVALLALFTFLVSRL